MGAEGWEKGRGLWKKIIPVYFITEFGDWGVTAKY